MCYLILSDQMSKQEEEFKQLPTEEFVDQQEGFGGFVWVFVALITFVGTWIYFFARFIFG